MCGIPMPPPEDVTTGRKLTFEQAVAHIGGMENFFTDEGRGMIARNAVDYLWKYPEHGYCTACGADVGDLKARHGTVMPCPACGKEVIFRHEARGHSYVFDQFCLYEWRKSVLDRQTIVLTAAHIWRNSMRDRPERARRFVKPTAIYIFRPGRAVTVYKNHRWSDDSMTGDFWDRIENIAPDHTGFQQGAMKFVQSYGQFRAALEGTRIGTTFDTLNEASNWRDTLELEAVASCARRPWLEYLAKAGQARLAAGLMRQRNITAGVIPNQRAKTPRELLGLTEAQWHEVRRDGIVLTEDLLRVANALRRAGLGNMHMADILKAERRLGAYCAEMLARTTVRRRFYHEDTIGDILARAPITDKLRRKALRRILADNGHTIEWRDYYVQLERVGEDMSNTALLMPKDMHAMHQRMNERERVLEAEKKARELEIRQRGFEKVLEKLKRRYTFEACGLVLRPYESAKEVITEGQALSICIGSYAERYLKGNTILCCLRRASAPDVPWRAVEFSAVSGAMVQDRGYKNDVGRKIPPEDQKMIDGFWQAWNESRKKGRKSA